MPRWSYFTVDADPTKYQTPITIELSPGPHKLHFTGNDNFPADKTVNAVVPDKDNFKVIEKLEFSAPK